MVSGSDFWGDVDEPMSRPTGLPEPRQHAIRWTSADVDGPPEAGVTSDLLSQNEKVTLTWPSATITREVEQLARYLQTPSGHPCRTAALVELSS